MGHVMRLDPYAGIPSLAAAAATGRRASPKAPSMIDSLLALQRSAGNAAVAHLRQRVPANEHTSPQDEPATTDRGSETRSTGRPELGRSPFSTSLVDSIEVSNRTHPLPGRAIGLSIQRSTAEGSDPDLVEHYTALMQSPVFRDLAMQVEKHGKIRLADTDEVPYGAYSSDSHLIKMPKTQEFRELRSTLVFEMHNALSRDSYARLDDLLKEGSGAAEKEAPHLSIHRRTTWALAVEWYEWVKTAEKHFRTLQIAADLGGDQISVTDYYPENYKKIGEEYFIFSEYLEDMVRWGHTEAYDKKSRDADWVGWSISSDVEDANPEACEITENELVDFRSGAKAHLKDPSDNPFASELGRGSAGTARASS
jgi:hypothetical protein